MPSPGGAAGRTLVVDPTFGVAGDMLLGALLDAGADDAFVRACVEAVLPGTVEIRVGRTTRAGMAANTLDVVLLREDQPHRPWRDVRGRLESAQGVPEAVRDSALRVFAVLAQAEGAVHGVPADDVQFHEVGAWDSITDVVGVVAALHSLRIERVQTLPVSVGTGTVRAAHGIMPIPVPAVLELLTGSGLPWQALPPGADDTATPPPHGPNAGHEHGHEDLHGHGHGHGHGHSHARGHEHLHGHGQGHGHAHERRHEHAHAHEDEHEHGYERENAYELSAADAGTTDSGRVGELATPTGVAVLAALAEPAGAQGAGSARRAIARGIGAGHKDFAAWPNVVRVTVTVPASEPGEPGEPLGAGEPIGPGEPGEPLGPGVPGGPGGPGEPGEPGVRSLLVAERLCVLEANLDDVVPRVWPSVLDELLTAGARDAWLTPLLGKKGRGGHTVSVLVDPREDDPEVFVHLLFDSTGTLGVRTYEVQRFALARAWATVRLPAPMTGEVRVKYGHRAGRIVHVTPEYEDCAAAARRAGVPILHVLEAARAAADAAGLRPGAAGC